MISAGRELTDTMVLNYRNLDYIDLTSHLTARLKQLHEHQPGISIFIQSSSKQFDFFIFNEMYLFQIKVGLVFWAQVRGVRWPQIIKWKKTDPPILPTDVYN